MESIYNQYDLVCKSCNHVNGHHEECTVENISFEQQQLQQARREGWEQGKMKAVIALGGCNTVEECWDAIAAMEYKEKAND